MWDIVWVSPQGHRSVSVSRHFLMQAPHCPFSVRKRFSRDHCCRGRSKPGCRIAGWHTRWELTTLGRLPVMPPSTFAVNWLQVQPQWLPECESYSNGGLKISGWIGQLSCLTIFSTSLSVAAFLRRADYDYTAYECCIIKFSRLKNRFYDYEQSLASW